MKLMEEVQNALRVKGYALKTERQYMNWIRRYVRHFLPKHPRETGVDGVREFLTYLAMDKNISPTTQNQCLAALLFLYRMLGIDLGDVGFIRAKKDKHLPTVLTEEEVMRLLMNMTGVYRIMGEVIYGGGLRLMECLRLRIKDLDLNNLSVTIRDTKSNRDRVTCLPASVVPMLKLHLAKALRTSQTVWERYAPHCTAPSRAKESYGTSKSQRVVLSRSVAQSPQWQKEARRVL
ncbi:MAG: phage integrase N-terminal SAM-like domain-containing protein [Chloroflexi bacterium]|nr:phage integrase N-terminal SAM-like domain-containing protein [Chloroflexota bacterium]